MSGSSKPGSLCAANNPVVIDREPWPAIVRRVPAQFASREAGAVPRFRLVLSSFPKRS